VLTINNFVDINVRLVKIDIDKIVLKIILNCVIKFYNLYRDDNRLNNILKYSDNINLYNRVNNKNCVALVSNY